MLHFIKRIAILYFVWFIIDFPYIYAQKGYFVRMDIIDSIGTLLKDLLLATTYPGSWFLSALVVAVLLVFIMSKFVGRWAMLTLSLLVSLYVAFHAYLPEQWQTAYEWYADNIRKEVNCSFPFALVWVSIGLCLAHPSSMRTIETIGNKYRSRLWVALALFYVAMVGTSPAIFVYPFVVTLFLVSVTASVAPKPIHRYMRNASILMFLFHFSIAGKKSLFLRVVGDDGTVWQLTYYMLVVVVSLTFAACVLMLEKRRHLQFLKYTH